jgi:hypothetical protein
VDQSLLTYPSSANGLGGTDKRRRFLEDFNGEHTASRVIGLIAAADLRGLEKSELGQGNASGQVSPSCIYLG